MKCSALLPDAQVKACGRCEWLVRHWLRFAAAVVLGAALVYGFVELCALCPAGPLLNGLTAFSFILLFFGVCFSWLYVPCKVAGERYLKQYRKERANG